MINGYTDVHKWHYIGSKDSSADYSFCGIDVAHDKATQKCFWGPPFLWKAELTIEDNKGSISQDDIEIKKCIQISCISTGKDILEVLESRISS